MLRGFLVFLLSSVVLTGSAQETRIVVIPGFSDGSLLFSTERAVSCANGLSSYVRSHAGHAGADRIKVFPVDFSTGNRSNYSDSLFGYLRADTASLWIGGEIKTAVIRTGSAGAGSDGLKKAVESGCETIIVLTTDKKQALLLPYVDYIVVSEDSRASIYRTANHFGDSVTVIDIGSDFGNVAVFRAVRPADASPGYLPAGAPALHARLTDVASFPPDDTFIRRFKAVTDSLLLLREKVLYRFGTETPLQNALFGPCEFTALVHAFQMQTTGTALSFFAPFDFFDSGMNGRITVRDIARLFPYANTLCVVELSGKEIVRCLEYSYARRFSRMTGEGSDLLRIGTRPDGTLEFLSRPYYFDSAGGIRYTVDVSKPVGKRITVHALHDGTPFDGNRLYRVAVNSFRAHGGGGHLVYGAGIPEKELGRRIRYESSEDYRMLLMKWLEERRNIPSDKIEDWNIIPEKWVESAKERESMVIGSER